VRLDVIARIALEGRVGKGRSSAGIRSRRLTRWPPAAWAWRIMLVLLSNSSGRLCRPDSPHGATAPCADGDKPSLPLPHFESVRYSVSMLTRFPVFAEVAPC
jgi:hypothetical protein